MLVRLALLLLVLAGGSAWAQGRRVALVVGNGAYRNVDRLANPANDARLMAATLREAGFTLVGDGPQIDLDKPRFDRALQAFGRALQGADVALFYYSGHGLQVNGVNWLVPVDANPTGARDLDFQMVDASLAARQMEGAGTKLNMMLLDACRNNPFAVRGVRGQQSGLAEMHAPEGTLISYATQPGNVAADGAGGNSPYTRAVVDAMRRPGLDVFQVFNRVGLAVKQQTGGDQQPWFASSPLSGTFMFFSGPVTIQPPPAAVDAEAVYWQSIAASADPADFRSYLERYPRGTYAELAQRRLAALRGPPQAALGGQPLAALRPFDGAWTVYMVCAAAQGGAQPYNRTLLGRVGGGVLHAESGERGKPSFIGMDGEIGADGRAVLRVTGLTGDARYNVNQSPAGAPYGFDVVAQFDGAKGTGQRTGNRSCRVDFTRQ